MEDALNYLFESNTLSKAESRQILREIAQGKYNHSQVSAFLTVYRMRSITVEELEGFRDAMLDLCLGLDFSAYNPIDLCGTGGDNKETFNISTLSSFVVAGAGVKVAKHGNYGVSSICGSSNVLESLGYVFRNDEERLKREIEGAGICVLHAPLFHPAMKFVGPIRKELGFKTFFNMLGPMVNPTFPKLQMVGVFSLELARLYAYLYQKSEKNYTIIHSLDGYDEVSLTGSFKLISRSREEIIDPVFIGLEKVDKNDLKGGRTIKESSDIFLNILQGKGSGPQKNVVCTNAGLAISCATGCTLEDGIEKARTSLESGSAYRHFKKLLEINSAA